MPFCIWKFGSWKNIQKTAPILGTNPQRKFSSKKTIFILQSNFLFARTAPLVSFLEFGTSGTLLTRHWRTFFQKKIKVLACFKSAILYLKVWFMKKYSKNNTNFGNKSSKKIFLKNKILFYKVIFFFARTAPLVSVVGLARAGRFSKDIEEHFLKKK